MTSIHEQRAIEHELALHVAKLKERIFMKRNEWEFEYTASKLAAAAHEQQAFREGRIEEWSARKEQVMQDIRDSGITIDESMADQMYGKYASNTTFGREPTLRIDPTLQQNLIECVRRVRIHSQFRDQYFAWVQILEAAPEARVKLQHDDWMFFFGKPPKGKEEDEEQDQAN